MAESKKKWVILPFLWRSLRRLCTIVGAMVLISLSISSYMALQLVGEVEEPKSNNIVLYLEFDGGFEELQAEASLSNPFGVPKPTIREVVAAIEAAAEDDRVKGILGRIQSGGGPSLAHAEEIRAALAKFHANSDKFSYIYSSSFSDGGGLRNMYLAGAFQERWMQPLGLVSIPGINVQVPYLKGSLEKIGVGTNFYQRKEYKTAYESLTNAEMSPAARENTNAMVDDLRDTLAQTIAGDLGLKDTAFNALVDQGLFTSTEAQEAGLITKAAYADLLVDQITKRVTGDPESEDIRFVAVKKYNKIAQGKAGEAAEGLLASFKEPEKDTRPGIALIYAVGAIMQDDVQSRAAAYGPVAAAEKIAPAILQAKDDDDIKAIVLRIDSPGGSPTASESILRAAEQAQEEGKPVIVSMGATAASGGYWISAYADRIFAQPSTLTGSIGVVGGKIYLQELWTKLGMAWEEISWGKNASLWSVNQPFSETEAVQINKMLDFVYDSFVARVAKGREMDPARVEQIARGRVWTGKQALDQGLVDQLGGLSDAIAYTAKEIGAPSLDDVRIEIIPKPKTPIEQFLDLLAGQVRMGQSMEAIAPVLEETSPVLQQLDVVRSPDHYTIYDPVALDFD